VMTEIAIIGSDIQEVIGSAIAIQIISHGKIPLFAGVLVTALDTFTFLLLERYGIRKLEAVFCSLISVMAIAFGIEYIISTPNQADVVIGVIVPKLSNNTVLPAIGVLGAIIMPHNIYLHSALVQSRKIINKVEANKYYIIEASIALLLSFIINLFVVSVFASGFYGVPDADNIGLQTAGNYLGEKYGSIARYIWAVGLLAAGQSSTMTGTYSGQFVMEGFLKLKLPPWKRLMITRGVAIIPAVIVALTAQQALDDLDQWLNILQSVQLPFALLPVLYACSCVSVMGYFVVGKKYRAFLSFVGVIVIAVNIYFVITFIISTRSIIAYVLSGIIGVAYSIFLVYLCYKVGKTFLEESWSKSMTLINDDE